MESLLTSPGQNPAETPRILGPAANLKQSDLWPASRQRLILPCNMGALSRTAGSEIPRPQSLGNCCTCTTACTPFLGRSLPCISLVVFSSWGQQRGCGKKGLGLPPFCGTRKPPLPAATCKKHDKSFSAGCKSIGGMGACSKISGTRNIDKHVQSKPKSPCLACHKGLPINAKIQSKPKEPIHPITSLRCGHL